MFVMYSSLNQSNFVEHDRQSDYSNVVKIDKRRASDELTYKLQPNRERDITVIVDEAGWVTYQPFINLFAVLLFSNRFRF